MLTTKNAGGLAPGILSPEEHMATVQMVKVRVLRAFYYDKQPHAVGSVVEMPRPIAIESVSARKAEFVRDAVPEPVADLSRKETIERDDHAGEPVESRAAAESRPAKKSK